MQGIADGGAPMSNLLGTIWIGLLLAVCPEIVVAGPFEDGNAAVERGDYRLLCGFGVRSLNKGPPTRNAVSDGCTQLDLYLAPLRQKT